MSGKGPRREHRDPGIHLFFSAVSPASLFLRRTVPGMMSGVRPWKLGLADIESLGHCLEAGFRCHVRTRFEGVGVLRHLWEGTCRVLGAHRGLVEAPGPLGQSWDLRG